MINARLRLLRLLRSPLLVAMQLIRAVLPAGLRGLDELESAEFQDRAARAVDAGMGMARDRSAGAAAVGQLELLARILSAVAAAVVVATFSIPLAVLLLALALGARAVVRRQWIAIVARLDADTAGQRHEYYISEQAVIGAAKDVRLFGLSDWFAGRFKSCWPRRPRWRSRRPRCCAVSWTRPGWPRSCWPASGCWRSARWAWKPSTSNTACASGRCRRARRHVRHDPARGIEVNRFPRTLRQRHLHLPGRDPAGPRRRVRHGAGRADGRDRRRERRRQDHPGETAGRPVRRSSGPARPTCPWTPTCGARAATTCPAGSGSGSRWPAR